MIKTETNAAAVVGAPVNLVPCPYCGQTHHLEIIKVQIVSGAKPDYAVKCEGCDAVGPHGPSVQDSPNAAGTIGMIYRRAYKRLRTWS